MNEFKQYNLVRIAQLLHPVSEYDGWRINRRPPQVGDIGTIIDILHAPDRSDNYVVESSDAEGITVWLGDFAKEELEPIEKSAYIHQHVDMLSSE